MAADMRTGLPRPVLGGSKTPGEGNNSRSRRSSDSRESCSCPDNVDVAPVLAMTYKRQDSATELFFVDMNSNVIYSTDLQGCNCYIAYKPNIGEDLGKQPWMEISSLKCINKMLRMKCCLQIQFIKMVFLIDISLKLVFF